MTRLLDSLRIWLVRFLKSLLSPIKFRGKGSLLLALCPKRGEINLSLFGYRFPCDLGEHIQRRIFLFNYDEKAQRFIRKNLKAGDTILDIGANVGFYTLLGASIVGEKGRVVAFEPNPKTFEKMNRTVQNNGIKNVLALNVGLGSRESEVELYFNSKLGNDSATMVPHDASESVKVKILTLDDVVAKNNIGTIAYVKIDVDGFEPEVFAGAKNILSSGKIKALQCEFSDVWLRRMNSSPEILHRFLKSMGFKDVDGEPTFESGSTVDRFFIYDK